jgi:hypothetical protein
MRTNCFRIPVYAAVAALVAGGISLHAETIVGISVWHAGSDSALSEATASVERQIFKRLRPSVAVQTDESLIKKAETENGHESIKEE